MARFRRPDRGRQAERLEPQFRALQQVLEARRAHLQVDAQGLVPEEVVVFETVGTVAGFLRAAERVPELEWMAEVEEEDIPPDDDFFALGKDGTRTEKLLRGRLFMVLANQTALREMLSLWASWQANQNLPRGLTPWRTLFEQLRTVRTWGVQDRFLETGILDEWRERVAHFQGTVRCEIELWFRSSVEQRHAARDRVTALVQALNGAVISEAAIDGIRYHGLLAELPRASVEALLDGAHDADLVQCEQIQFIRATGQMATAMADDHQIPGPELEVGPAQLGDPVIALLDGLPIQNHQLLAGRLVIDDPENFEADYPASLRRHGTAMASLILHGDLGRAEPPLTRRLYVRPILKPSACDWVNPRPEAAPEQRLVVDVIHEAVRRIFEPGPTRPAAARRICIVNLSIGLRDRLFDNTLSPLARLLDWLAWRYQVLFLVSAGNHLHPITLDTSPHDACNLQGNDLQREVLKAIASDARHRRLLSPAESMNALTVGAIHSDASNAPAPAGCHLPYVDEGLPSVFNAQGMGHRRSIKPDILLPGGQVVLRESPRQEETGKFEIVTTAHRPGLRVASPGAIPGDVSSTWYSRGTSDATALASRAAAQLYEVLEELGAGPSGELIETVPRAIWLKALLAHSASWGNAGAVLDGILRTDANSRQFREYVTRLLGYGSVDPDRVRECTPQRVTALSGGALGSNQAHIHRFPLPPGLAARTGLRCLVLTLAWFSPVNPRHQAWRCADLWFHPDARRPPKAKDPLTPLRLERREADWKAVQRGTLQHEILEGDQAAVYVDGAEIEVVVSCREDAGRLEEAVPYALAMSLEVAPEIGIDIYNEVRTRIEAARVEVAPAAE